MSERFDQAVDRAHRALDRIYRGVVFKTIWGSPAGKKRLAKRLAAMLPPHDTYVEPFAGSAAVLFAKEPARTEVINDADPEIAQAYQAIKSLTPDKIARLRKMPWTGNEATFKKLFDAKPISRDMEEVAINGDRASADPFLATLDGVLVQATSNIVDAAGAPLSKELLRDMLRSLPSEHLRDKKSMRFMTSVDADLGYRNTLAERATAVGDRLLENDTPVLYSGVPVQPIPLFPEDLGADSDQTEILLCNPKNIHVGILRQIRMESGRDISEGTLKIVATLRFDVKYAEEPGTAKAINVSL